MTGGTKGATSVAVELDGELGRVADAAQVEEEAPVVHASHDRRPCPAEPRRDVLGTDTRMTHGERSAGKLDPRCGAATDLARRRYHLDGVFRPESGAQDDRGRAADAFELRERA